MTNFWLKFLHQYFYIQNTNYIRPSTLLAEGKTNKQKLNKNNKSKKEKKTVNGFNEIRKISLLIAIIKTSHINGFQ